MAATGPALRIKDARVVDRPLEGLGRLAKQTATSALRLLYIGSGPNAPARGPFVAPADPMTVAPQYGSNKNEGPGS